MYREKPAKKVLFMTNCEYGQANVILAVAYELLLRQDHEVHVASFASFKNRVTEINELASTNSESGASAATFHTINGPSAQESAIAKAGDNHEFIGPFPPGLRGAKNTYRITLPAMATVWDGPVYMSELASCIEIIDSIQPDLVACDPLLGQALEACEARSCNTVVLSPNTFREILGKQQPIFKSLITYPALASAFPYPVPWYLIFANVYLKICLMWILITHPKVKEMIRFRVSQNLPKLPPPFNIWKAQNHYLVPSIPETDFPCRITPNVTPCGPILLPEAPLRESDPKLLAWLEQSPTVLINLGSHIRMDDAQAREFAGALNVLLHNRPDLQVLWKLKKKGGLALGSENGTYGAAVSSESLKAIETFIDSGRVRVEEWLSVDPVAVLESGHVVCSVHHGGSNSFHEAVNAGVPQVVLPCWMDTFDFANRVEYLGIGVYGSRNHSPRVEANELSTALMRVLGEGKEGLLMRAKAEELAAIAGKMGGRVRACEKIVELLEAAR